MKYFDLKNEMIFDSLKTVFESKNITGQYIDVEEEYLAESQNFDVLTISYFDHFLSEYEYSKEQFVSYSSVFEHPDYIYEIEKIFDKFFQIFSFIYDENQGDVYAECSAPVQVINNKEQFMRSILNALKERPIGTFVFINIQVTVSIGYDFTYKIYLKSNSYIKNRLIDVILAQGIYLLS
ncbi:hypothetical protein [Neisseria yangbaofengii]|uniref:hypothetical protein n=1 Tax=Neisseria yangbaofengii TaxID=2709396 RepID=UPI0013ED84C8|nr:hypothetical protein [Neisseria yangbaofengii]